MKRLRSWLRRMREELSSARRRVAYRREIRRAIAEGRQPVIVFTMAKSASTSVEASLMQLPELAVYKAHRLHPARIRAYYRERRRLGETEPYRFVDDLALALHAEILSRRVPAQVIALVREPIARNLSAYFHILEVLWGRADAAALSTDELAAGFLEKGRHQVPLDWFDEEFRPVFGVDVFSRPFPTDRGFVRTQAGAYDILIMRADLPDAEKSTCLAEFLGRESVDMVRRNEAGTKHYAHQYETVRRGLHLPASYVATMLDSRYARHFFSPAELSVLRARWGSDSAVATAAQPPQQT